MPYIKPELRDITIAKNPGELNYLITKLCNEYLKNNTESYRTMNDIIGALEGAKLEFYRRVITPYENQKCFENGDVYGV